MQSSMQCQSRVGSSRCQGTRPFTASSNPPMPHTRRCHVARSSTTSHSCSSESSGVARHNIHAVGMMWCLAWLLLPPVTSHSSDVHAGSSLGDLACRDLTCSAERRPCVLGHERQGTWPLTVLCFCACMHTCAGDLAASSSSVSSSRRQLLSAVTAATVLPALLEALPAGAAATAAPEVRPLLPGRHLAAADTSHSLQRRCVGWGRCGERTAMHPRL